MLCEKLDAVYAALGSLGGQVSNESWEHIQVMRRELKDATEQAATLENQIPLNNDLTQLSPAQKEQYNG